MLKVVGVVAVLISAVYSQYTPEVENNLQACSVSAVCSTTNVTRNVNFSLGTIETSIQLKQIQNEVLELHRKLNRTTRRALKIKQQQDAMIAVLRNHLHIVEVRVRRIERTLSLNHLRTTLGDFNQGWYDGGNGYEYRIKHNYIALSYGDARSMCTYMGSKIATVGVRQETTFNALKKLFRTKTAYIYIGLTDRVDEGTWVWDDGMLADHYWTNWIRTEPNNAQNNEYNGEDCAFITPHRPHQWNDSPCYTPGHVLCERPTHRQ